MHKKQGGVLRERTYKIRDVQKVIFTTLRIIIHTNIFKLIKFWTYSTVSGPRNLVELANMEILVSQNSR